MAGQQVGFRSSLRFLTLCLLLLLVVGLPLLDGHLLLVRPSPVLLLLLCSLLFNGFPSLNWIQIDLSTRLSSLSSSSPLSLLLHSFSRFALPWWFPGGCRCASSLFCASLLSPVCALSSDWAALAWIRGMTPAVTAEGADR